jgi:diaminopimelate decarboxylase
MPAHPAGPRHTEAPRVAAAQPAPADRPTAGVWPASAERGRDGQLIIGGVDVRDAVAEHGSPLFILDRAHFADLAAEYRREYDGATVYYAGKAFLTGAIARWVAAAGLSLDVASGGELEVALRAGFPAQRILFHGNNKSVAEIEAALDAGVGRIVIDSFLELARVAAAAADRSVVADVMVRVTLGVEAHTHEFIATAHEDQKFGLSVASGDALEAVRRIVGLPALHLVGLHSHIGSQIFDAAGFEVAAHRMMRFAAQVQDVLGATVAEINLGGGMGIAYTAADDPPRVAAMAQQLRGIIAAESRAAAGVRAGPRPDRPGRRDVVRGRHREAGGTRRRAGAHLRLRGRRYERQHPHRPL